MSPTVQAILVHVFTATGAVFAMLAMLAAAEGDWPMMVLWLIVAFAVDGVDGPLARRFHVRTHGARFDGDLLDLIIDYLTYVFIPAFALFKSGLLPGWTGWVAIILITFASALYFADTRMKTGDKSFNGFPGCWNMVVAVLFVVEPSFWLILGLVTALAVAMFLPLRFIHPVRTKRWRALSLPVAVLWSALVFWAAWHEFEAGVAAIWALSLASVYLLFAGVAQQLLPDRR